jgi:cytochrome c peroxidase
MGGTDNLKTSIGHNWQQGPINSPTVLNSTFNIAQFWDGRAKDLKEQAGGPIGNPKEMASNHDLAVKVISSIPAYVEEFKLAFSSSKVDIDKITTAIAEFEKTLITPNSRFDQWLAGKKEAITLQEKAGYELFKTSGCVACHNGVAIGASTYQKMGVIKPYKTENNAKGRFSVTGKEADKFVFKVPTLRNIELTYPYFHDGNASSLTEAVNIMGNIQLGKEFTKEEASKIVAFLKTLTGDQPSFKMPILPPSNNTTPKPDPFGK